ncbi:HNH endonuclease [Alkalihalobacillus sp. BA299]|uniref:HNH endonuclease n=1 Tax=Alkalihalobacillus sp. BA299 TaxID=2815938 RepID=UPI001ADB47FA|nr:HNH endonuclease [Alkalihalobacillus sp. BA299]
MKLFAKQFYKSKAWRNCRDAYFISQHGLCERCHSPGKVVHHTVYLSPDNIHDPTISLNHDLLELLCATCHQHEHFKKEEVIREGLSFDENGDLIQL